MKGVGRVGQGTRSGIGEQRRLESELSGGGIAERRGGIRALHGHRLLCRRRGGLALPRLVAPLRMFGVATNATGAAQHGPAERASGEVLQVVVPCGRIGQGLARARALQCRLRRLGAALGQRLGTGSAGHAPQHGCALASLEHALQAQRFRRGVDGAGDRACANGARRLPGRDLVAHLLRRRWRRIRPLDRGSPVVHHVAVAGAHLLGRVQAETAGRAARNLAQRAVRGLLGRLLRQWAGNAAFHLVVDQLLGPLGDGILHRASGDDTADPAQRRADHSARAGFGRRAAAQGRADCAGCRGLQRLAGVVAQHVASVAADAGLALAHVLEGRAGQRLGRLLALLVLLDAEVPQRVRPHKGSDRRRGATQQFSRLGQVALERALERTAEPGLFLGRRSRGLWRGGERVDDLWARDGGLVLRLRCGLERIDDGHFSFRSSVRSEPPVPARSPRGSASWPWP